MENSAKVRKQYQWKQCNPAQNISIQSSIVTEPEMFNSEALFVVLGSGCGRLDFASVFV